MQIIRTTPINVCAGLGDQELPLPGDRRTARAEFFSLILRMLETPDQGRATEGEGGEALLRSVHALKDNSGRTERLLNQKMQKCGGSSLTARSRNLISTIIQDAERLALRMGAQRAHVMFRRPSHRDLITLDEYFGHDGGHIAYWDIHPGRPSVGTLHGENRGRKRRSHEH